MTDSEHQRLLMNGRGNTIDTREYDGPRPVKLAFDPADLYCYLAENAAPDAEMDDLINLFERQFHELPDLTRQEIQLEAAIPVIYDDPDDPDTGDRDQPVTELVELFVSGYVTSYTNRNRMPPLGLDADPQPLTPTHSNSAIRESPPPQQPVRSQTSHPEKPSDELSVPLVSEAADFGYRTGRNIARSATRLWERVTSTPDDDPAIDADTAVDSEQKTP